MYTQYPFVKLQGCVYLESTKLPPKFTERNVNKTVEQVLQNINYLNLYFVICEQEKKTEKSMKILYKSPPPNNLCFVKLPTLFT